ncbi:MAG: hypothetical protein ABIV26_08200, partial [Candidatus Limnocylindrales bacterium]
LDPASPLYRGALERLGPAPSSRPRSAGGATGGSGTVVIGSPDPEATTPFDPGAEPGLQRGSDPGPAPGQAADDRPDALDEEPAPGD